MCHWKYGQRALKIIWWDIKRSRIPSQIYRLFFKCSYKATCGPSGPNPWLRRSFFIVFTIKTPLNAGQRKKTINLHTCSHKCHIVHAVISDNWLQSMPALLHSHQKRALSEWPHPAYEWGQQQEVDVTIDRLRVILERPQAPTHLSANAPSMNLFLLTSINKEMQVYFSFCGFFPSLRTVAALKLQALLELKITQTVNISDSALKYTWIYTCRFLTNKLGWTLVRWTGPGAKTELCFKGSDLLLLWPVWKSWAAASAATSSHWMNPVPCLSHGSEGHCLPCCQWCFHSFISGCASWRGHSHSMQMGVVKMPHSHSVSGTQTTENHHRAISFFADQYKRHCFCSIFCP